MPTSSKTAIPFEGTNPEETNDAYFVQTPNNQGNVSGEESDVSFTADLQSSGEESLEEHGVTRTSRTTLNLEYDHNPSNVQLDTSTCISSAAGFGANPSTGTSNLFGQPTAQATTGSSLFDQSKSLFGNTTTTTQSAFGCGTQISTGTSALFGQATQNKGGMLLNKFAFEAKTTSTGGFEGFATNTEANFLANPCTATTSSGFSGALVFGAAEPTGSSLAITSAAPPVYVTGEMSGAGTSMFGNTLGTKGTIGGFNSTSPTDKGLSGLWPSLFGLGNIDQTLGGTANQAAGNQTVQHDSSFFFNMEESTTKREDVLNPTNPVVDGEGNTNFANMNFNDTEDKFPDKEDEAYSNLTVAKGYKPKEKRPKDHQKDPSSLIKDVMCHVCSVEVSNIVFLPCSHLYSCESCANKEPKCKICRKQVEKKLKVYRN